MGFQHRADAVRFLEQFKERLAKFGLELHPEDPADRVRAFCSPQTETVGRGINRLWRNVLVRRSQRAKKKSESLTPVFDRWIPIPRILHPYPHARFNATHPS
jgi:hypothetical protein